MGKIGQAIQTQQNNAAVSNTAKKSVQSLLNSMLDSEGYRKRFDELMGKRAPQFISSIVSLVNADANLQQAFCEAPQTVIQSALKAATFDLPIDQNLGYAYIVPFKNSYKDANGNWRKRTEATFILGYKGMNQLALRSGAYKTINVLDIREGELKSYNRLTEDIEFQWIEDEEEREKTPIVGWCGYFRLRNGTTKTIYMTRKQIEAHEKKHRKGEYMGKGWKENFDDMAAKTVFRRLIGKFGLMSIDYQRADDSTIAFADALATGKIDGNDEPSPEVIETDFQEVNDPQPSLISEGTEPDGEN